MSKLKTAASSVKSLASKIDDLKSQAKSLDEVIRALKKAITDMEVATSHNDQEVVPKDTMDQETTASQGSSNSTSNISSTEVVTMTTATSADAIFNLATIESGTGPSDNVVSKIDDELHPTATASVGAESAELPQAAVTVAVRSPGTITTEEDMYEEEQTNVETNMRMSTTDSDRRSLENKANIQDLEDILPMEQ